MSEPNSQPNSQPQPQPSPHPEPKPEPAAPWIWVTPALSLWGIDTWSTYTSIPYSALPPIASTDDWSWLPPTSWDALDILSPSATLLARHAADAAALGLHFPPSLAALFDPNVADRIPSCTACYLELGSRMLPLPDGRRALRFLNDQQSCVTWFIVLERGRAYVAVGHMRYRDMVKGEEEVGEGEGDEDGDGDEGDEGEEGEGKGEKGDEVEDRYELLGVFGCAESLGEFVRRFWVENTLWFEANGDEEDESEDEDEDDDKDGDVDEGGEGEEEGREGEDAEGEGEGRREGKMPAELRQELDAYEAAVKEAVAAGRASMPTSEGT